MNDRATVRRRRRSRAPAATAPAGVALFDAALRLAAWNASFAALRGYPRRLLKTGTPLESFVRFDAGRGEYGAGAIETLTRARLAALKRGRPALREHALSDGRALRIACERIPEGGLLLTCEDVTDARRTAQRLRESEERYREALEQQTATSEILGVVASSPTDLQLVLDIVVRDAARLCEADNASLFQAEGDRMRRVAGFGSLPVSLKIGETRALTRGSASGRAMIDRQTLHMHDFLALDLASEYPDVKEAVEREGIRTCLATPLVREGVPIGALTIYRTEVRPFTANQIELVKTFADQAAIAIENVRLFHELQARNRDLSEALEQQTATAEILGVIARTPRELQPVLDAVAENAARLCDAQDATIRLVDGDFLRAVAHKGPIPPSEERLRIHPGLMAGRAVLERRTLHVGDFLAESASEFSESVARAELHRVRANVVTPLLREGVPLGTIGIRRREARPFSDSQIKLLETFAAQAVIAIENVRLFNELESRNRELTESLEQRTATAEILRVISGSPTDVRPVFEEILRAAVGVCHASLAAAFRFDGELLHLAATHNWPPEALAWASGQYPKPPNPGLISGRTILSAGVVRLVDALNDPHPASRDAAAAGGWRRMLGVPMLREGVPIGAIVVAWPESGETPDRQVELLRTFADQAVIAVENVRLFNETKEALEKQTAISEILRVISASPTDVQPVFETIVRSAVTLCGSTNGAVFRYDGERLHYIAGHRFTPQWLEAVQSKYPLRPDPSTISGRAILTMSVAHIDDVLADPQYDHAHALQGGWRRMVAVPMLKEGVPLGVIVVAWAQPGATPKSQEDLLKTFADQAVIAIENVRLFNETKEALDQLKASAEVLQVISSSVADTKPVFETILESCERLFEGRFAGVGLVGHDGAVHLGAYHGPGREALEKHFPVPLSEESGSGMTILQRRVIHYPDVEGGEDVPEYMRRGARISGYKSAILAPMLWEGRGIGVIFVGRDIVGEFSEKEIALLKTFADQAVIAIQNARLFNETKEALERQTATAEILKVISESPTDVQPVFDAIVSHAGRLAPGCSVNVSRIVGDQLHLAAYTRVSPEADEALKSFYPIGIGEVRSTIAEAVRLRTSFLVSDHETDPRVSPKARAVMRARGFRSTLYMPLVRGDVVYGVMHVSRVEPGPFPEQWVSLLKTFADQAVIAIENVRLFNETKEALEQQTATADILKVMSGSPTDVQPVFDAIANSGVRLFQGVAVSLRVVKGDRIERVAFAAAPGCEVSVDSANAALPLDDRSFAGRAVLQRKLIHVPDIPAADWVGEASRTANERMGARAIAVAPMLRENKVLGAIAVTRARTGPFSDKDLALLTTFADQAVIAIENVRLFNETKEALDHQKASAEVLQVISSSVADTAPVFEKILESCQRLFGGHCVGIPLLGADGAVHLGAYQGRNQETFARNFPTPLDGSGTGAAIRHGGVIRYPDVDAPGVPPFARLGATAIGFRSVMFAPLLWEGQGIGAIFVGRDAVGEFSEKEIALLKTFADQAVIAIQNARLFNETNEALERQTATAEILKVISASPTDVQPVFDAIVKHAGRLAAGSSVNVSRLVGDRLDLAAYTEISPEADEALKSAYPVGIDEVGPIAEAIGSRSPILVADWETDSRVGAKPRAVMRARGFHSTLYVPIVRGDTVYGVMHVSKVEAGPFPDHWVNMLRIFADQAVIAIENVRLFNETKEALDQLKASAEVLQVISSSVADTQPVFDKILESCGRLFEGRNVGITLVGDDGVVRLGPYRGPHRRELESMYPLPLSSASGSGSAILARRVMHYPDTEGGADVPEPVRRGSRIIGSKSIVFSPMLWEGRAIGTIFVGRATVGEFSEKEIGLLKTFADQAVIAIQNARLFNEIREKSHQLEIANQHKSAFLANMSHELRTPLNAVIGFSEMLAARYFGSLTDKQAEYVGDIHASGKHLLSLINDILDLSKIEAGRMELEEGEFDLRAALDNALTLVRERAQRSGVALRLETDPALGAFHGDERKLKQVVLNLLSNAVKFTPRGGAVGVVARRANGSAEIAVTDTGVGIAPQDQEAIFEAFRQVGTDVTRKREGTGLGLALSRRFVELHGGTISVESEPGKGSKFTVTLPLRHGE